MFIKKPQEPSRLVAPHSMVIDVEDLLNISDETQLLLKIQKFLKLGLWYFQFEDFPSRFE